MSHELDLHFIVQAHSRSLLAQALRLTRNEADARDLLQDTFMRAMEGERRMTEAPANMRAWLCVIMRRHWFNVVRQRRAQSAGALRVGDQAVDTSLVDTRASFEQFERAWRQLPQAAQSIAAQCLIYEEPYGDVSNRVGMAKASIATSIHRTRRHLKEAMFGR